eukprot:scaffold4556_cov212-Pinguiococcus_pyrenoidosus.AAC.1
MLNTTAIPRRSSRLAQASSTSSLSDVPRTPPSLRQGRQSPWTPSPPAPSTTQRARQQRRRVRQQSFASSTSAPSVTTSREASKLIGLTVRSFFPQDAADWDGYILAYDAKKKSYSHISQARETRGFIYL